MHVPGAAPQVSQLPLHPLPQHTLSTQCPDSHCRPRAHAAPSANASVHAPELQKYPSPQPSSPPQLVGHTPDVPLQRYGPHDGDSPAVPAATTVHTPGVAEHSSHPPAHGPLQQYPSAQYPLWHCRPRAHPAPDPSAPTHVLPLHQLPLAHSASLPHVPGHVPLVPLHTYGAHAGCPVPPALTTRHIPGTRLHASHAPPHPLSQQYPSTHCPLWHCRARVHTDPVPTAGTHSPAVLHQNPPAHSPSVPQPPGQYPCTPSHVCGAHGGDTPGCPAPRTWHVPGAELHSSQPPAHALSQQYPSTHCPDRH